MPPESGSSRLGHKVDVADGRGEGGSVHSATPAAGAAGSHGSAERFTGESQSCARPARRHDLDSAGHRPVPLHVCPERGAALVPDRGHPVVTVRTLALRKGGIAGGNAWRRSGRRELRCRDGTWPRPNPGRLSDLAAPDPRNSRETAIEGARQQTSARRVPALAELDRREPARQCRIRSTAARRSSRPHVRPGEIHPCGHAGGSGPDQSGPRARPVRDDPPLPRRQWPPRPAPDHLSALHAGYTEGTNSLSQPVPQDPTGRTTTTSCNGCATAATGKLGSPFSWKVSRETSQQAADTARELRDLFEKDWRRIEGLGRSAASALRVHQRLQRDPFVSVPEAARNLRLSPPTVANAIRRLESRGILRETTGKQRGRLYVYDAYLDILGRGTEPL